MPDMDPRITEFIRKHHIFTLATAVREQPYVCTCFYVYLEKENLFIFTSDHGTRHVDELLLNPRVAGAIALETTVVGKIQGIQFTGISRELDGEAYESANRAYLRKFPVAAFKKLTLWSLEPDFIKMTHNRLGFGKKLVWRKGAEEAEIQ